MSIFTTVSAFAHSVADTAEKAAAKFKEGLVSAETHFKNFEETVKADFSAVHAYEVRIVATDECN
jgi:hypothetical protein